MRKGTTSSKKKSVGFESESETIRALRREIEIEAALERVRAASMAMHKSDELAKVVKLLNMKVAGLGIQVSVEGVGTEYIINIPIT